MNFLVMFRSSQLFRRNNLNYIPYSKIVESGGKQVLKEVYPPKLVKLVPRPKYGGENLVTLITGSTIIGETGASYIKTLFRTAKVPVALEWIKVSRYHENQDSNTPNETLISVMRNRTAIHIDLQYDPEEKLRSLLLNNHLDLYACIIKLNSIEGFKSKFPNLDLILALQNNSGDFSKMEYEPVKGVVETIRNSQDESITRYLRFVYKFAIQNCRKKITFGHNVHELPLSDGRFMEIASCLHKTEFSELIIDDMPINSLVRCLIMKPQKFDMICTTDRYGTFVAAIASAVCGGASLFSAIELGDAHAVFKPLQTKLSITDHRLLSPYGIVRACIDLLIYLGNFECAHILSQELMNTMIKRNVKTEEFCGKSSGDFVICDIVNNLSCKFA